MDQLFDLRVLDPAMGSGHFLVEAVDFICDRVIGQRDGFLQAFPWNPMTAFLEETRRDILTEMERQGVSVDAGRLTDINLLKRHVLKRCVYGVDLNPMAVELAKVSLWLDCFTLGAPLSFLDHHLKCGNSLIGTTVQDVQAELATKDKQTISMFGGPFQGLLSATATMLELARTPDVTAAEAEKSRNLFGDFESKMAPYKRALDIWTSRHFGNTLAQEYLTLVGRDFIEEIRSGGAKLSPQYRDVISNAVDLGREKRFFHWDLEFPEAFVDLERSTWKRSEDQGFDAIVGNPPWLMAGYYLSDAMVYLQQAFATAVGKFDIYYLFVERGFQFTSEFGNFGMIIPNKFFHTKAGTRLRSLLGDQESVREIVDFGDEQIFEGATNYSCLLFLTRELDSTPLYSKANASLFKSQEIGVPTTTLSSDIWHFEDLKTRKIFEALEACGEPLEIMTERFGTGVQSGADRILIVGATTASELQLEQNSLKRMLRGRDVRKYEISPELNYIIFPYKMGGGKFVILTEQELSQCTKIYGYLNRHRDSLENRVWFGKSPDELTGKWYGLMYLDAKSSFDAPHILTPSLAKKSEFALGTGDLFATGTAGVTSIIPRTVIEESILYILGVLNSNLISFYIICHSPVFSGGYHKFSAPYLKKVPIKRINFHIQFERNRHDEVVSLVDKELDLHKEIANNINANDAEAIQKRIEDIQNRLNELIFELYGLEDDQILLIEQAV